MELTHKIESVFARRNDEAIRPITTDILLKLMSRTQNIERDSVVVQQIASSFLLAMTTNYYFCFYFHQSITFK